MPPGTRIGSKTLTSPGLISKPCVPTGSTGEIMILSAANCGG